MTGWVVALIIIVVLAFIFGNVTALLKQGGFDFPDSYEKPDEKSASEKEADDDKPSGFY
jgi:predicted small lipoprotein YifL